MTVKPTIINLNYVYATASDGSARLVPAYPQRDEPWMVIAGKKSKAHKTHAKAVAYAAKLCGKGRK